MAARRTAAKPVASRSGWTPRRRTRFLEALALSANVTASAASVRMSKSAAYALRRRDASFARAWDEALRTALDELEAVAFERAINGVEKIVVRAQGEKVAIREYSDRLLMYMLDRRRADDCAGEGTFEAVSERDICAEIEARVAAIEARRADEQA